MKSIYVMIKPSSGSCNLRCTYCFYADECARRTVPSYGFMSTATLESVVRKTLQAAAESCTFAFQGGEPTLVGLDFYKEYVRLVALYQGDIQVHTAIQTNGIVIDEAWAAFFATHGFLVGLSCDGNKGTHDRYRTFPDGQGSFDRVMQTAALLNRYHVEYNILTVITPFLAENIAKVYRFYRGQGLLYQQYIPCIDPPGEGSTGACGLSPLQLGKFYCTLFDLWYADLQKGSFIYIRYFENLVGMLLGIPPETCGLSGCCSVSYLLEADGSTFPCDFYATDRYLLGNYVTDSLEGLDQQRRAMRFVEDSPTTQAACAACTWFPLCRGGCRRDRDPLDTGVLELNRFCEGYKRFFAYAYPRLKELAIQAKLSKMG